MKNRFSILLALCAFVLSRSDVLAASHGTGQINRPTRDEHRHNQCMLLHPRYSLNPMSPKMGADASGKTTPMSSHISAITTKHRLVRRDLQSVNAIAAHFHSVQKMQTEYENDE